MTNQYNIIGDIHGHADELETLLTELGYDNSYNHPEGDKVIFLGDFIDRGTQNERVITIVRTMCDQGSALAVMGNHEYNALCYQTYDYDRGFWLRAHTKTHFEQHEMFLREYENRPDDLQDVLQWIMKLPLFLHIPGVIRVVHACWDGDKIEAAEDWVSKGNLIAQNYSDNAYGASMTMKFLFATSEKDDSGVQKGSPEYEFIETILKGPEAALFTPDGERTYFLDKGGARRYNTRLRWFGDAKGSLRQKTLSIPDEPTGMEKLESENAQFEMSNIEFYSDTVPVFFGHYWMTADAIDDAITHNAACVDYSIAKNGHLAAYSFRPNDSNGKLSKDNYRMIKNIHGTGF